jgi:hypothetical protein
MVERNALAALELSDRSRVLEQGRVNPTGTGRALLDDPHSGKRIWALGIERAVASAPWGAMPRLRRRGFQRPIS